MRYIHVDGRRLLTVAAYIPGGINMVRTGTTATADQFGEAKMLRKLLGTGAPDGRLTAAPGFTPPSFRASYRASPTAAAGPLLLASDLRQGRHQVTGDASF